MTTTKKPATARTTARAKAAAAPAAEKRSAAAAKTVETTAKSAAETTLKTVADANEAAKAMVSESTEKAAGEARAFVKSASAAAMKTSALSCDGMVRFNSGFEKSMNRLVVGYAGILSDVAGATHDGIMRAVDAVERASKAKSIAEATDIQTNYLRETMTKNLEDARNIASVSNDIVTESAEMLRDSVTGIWALARKAA